MVKAKAKKMFTAKSTQKPKSIQKKAKVAPTPKDAMEALIQQASRSLAVTEAEKENMKKKAHKKAHEAKARRSVVRKKHKQKVAGAKHKGKRKGIN